MSNVRALNPAVREVASRVLSGGFPSKLGVNPAVRLASLRLSGQEQSHGAGVPAGSAVIGPAQSRRAGVLVGSGASYARAAGVAAFGYASARRKQACQPSGAATEFTERLAVSRMVEYDVVECFKAEALSERGLT